MQVAKKPNRKRRAMLLSGCFPTIKKATATPGTIKRFLIQWSGRAILTYLFITLKVYQSIWGLSNEYRGTVNTGGRFF